MHVLNLPLGTQRTPPKYLGPYPKVYLLFLIEDKELLYKIYYFQALSPLFPFLLLSRGVITPHRFSPSCLTTSDVFFY